MNNVNQHTNRLINAASPYLIQHAHNPVDWWEWCDEAFEKAKREDKLVLVSIGYSACHWCHVMAHECFENEDIAAIMNERYVCIKVDREERPDIDQIYMDAVQLLTGSGGWPLNCFTLPDGRPIHGGTYFPIKEWENVLVGLSTFYQTKKEEALNYATNLTGGVRQMNMISPAVSDKHIAFSEIQSILKTWSESFDREWGGQNWAPKFPMPLNLQLFLHASFYDDSNDLLSFVETTLTRMADGGLFDQVGGGFARYSTDMFWKVPHFEKMLYDNAQLLSLYANVYRHTGNKKYITVIEKTHHFLVSSFMQSNSLFASALDADSEGVEGKYYVWTKNELEALLGADAQLFCLYYSVTDEGNWEGENILYKSLSDEELQQVTGKVISDIMEVITRCEEILKKERDKRIKPGLDDKIITSWNALLIKGYADVYMATEDHQYLTLAQAIADSLWQNHWKDGKLYRIQKDGKISIAGFSEDYATLCEALLSVYEASGEEKYANDALELMNAAIARFYAKDKKLFYFTDNESNRLIAEKYDISDDVIPSSNSLFAKSLIKLSYLFSNAVFQEMADNMLFMVQEKMLKYPSMYGNWFQVLLWKHKGYLQLISNEFSFSTHQPKYYPNLMCCKVDAHSSLPLLIEKKNADLSLKYLCKDMVCNLPSADWDEIHKQINQTLN